MIAMTLKLRVATLLCKKQLYFGKKKLYFGKTVVLSSP
jgi:hypothetical protein